jgi:translocation and assembly module TamB
MAEKSRTPTFQSPGWDLGRLVARVLCAVFAVIGALPLLGGVLVRSAPIQRWTASETARVLKEQLGVTATYQVRMKLWPLQVSIRNLVVPSSDGGAPALRAARIAVTPRIFSLLAGRLDVGDIEIDEPAGRAVIRHGKLVNVAYRLPRPSAHHRHLKRAPFSSLAVNGGQFDLDVDGVRVKTGPMDIDVFADRGPSFEVAVRAGQSAITRTRKMWVRVSQSDNGPDVVLDKKGRHFVIEPAHDEDAICRLDLRAHLEKGDLLLRRLSLLGVADDDPARGTRPTCKGVTDNDAWSVLVRLSQVRVVRRPGEPWLVDGHVVARAPAGLANRFVRTGTLHGWLGLVADVRYDGTTRLPEVHGKFRGGDLQISIYRLAKTVSGQVDIANDEVRVPTLTSGFADGTLTLQNGLVRPFAKGATLTAERLDGSGVRFEAMMRDLGVTPNTIVRWNMNKTRVTKVHGTFVPLHLDGNLYSESSDFEVFDRAYHDPARRHMIGVRAAVIHARVGVRPDAFQVYDARVDFGHSTVLAPLVSIGFHNDLALRVANGSQIDLADVTPLVDIPMAGTAKLDLTMSGLARSPLLTGDVSVQGFEFGGYPLGDIESAKFRFRPLAIEFSDVHGEKGPSRYTASSARLDFNHKGSVIADATVHSDDFDVRDFFKMWHFDEDPRFDDINGKGAVDATVHYALGGAEDRCDGGNLRVQGNVKLSRLDLFGESFDSGRADFDFKWPDQRASYLGIDMNMPSITLRKGTGTLLGSFTVKPGGVVRGQLIATRLPLSRIDSFGDLSVAVEGHASAVAEISGTIDQLALDSHVNISPVRIAGATLPASSFSVDLVPTARSTQTLGKTDCGQPIPAPFQLASYDRDVSEGVFHFNGNLFGGQVKLNDLRVTRQRHRVVSGDVAFSHFNLGALAELNPAVALSESKPMAWLSAALHIDRLPTSHPALGRAQATITELSARNNGFLVDLESGAQPIVLADGELSLPGLSLALTTPGGERGVFDVRGKVRNLGTRPVVDASLALRPIDLSALASFMPRVERAQGKVRGRLTVTGPLRAPSYHGGFELENGEVSVRGLPTSISNIQLALAVDNDELNVTRGSAQLGGGKLSLRGSAPLRGFRLGSARAVLTARQIGVPLGNGVHATVDADLVGTWQAPAAGSDHRALPHVTGQVTLRSFEYTRPVTMTADISALAQHKQAHINAYDPSNDFVDFDITLLSPRPLKIQNNLIDADLLLDPSGLLIAGTNQHMGLRGVVRVKPGGHIRFRRSDFEIRQGFVRFDDLTRVAPQVDVTAVTDYRRYSENTTASTQGASASSAASAGASGAATARGGEWHITMHAYGNADNLRIDLTSEPELAQDDIFLLLTVGLTRAELDQAQSASVGESVALEALGSLSGADRAVTSAVPMIDEFRFGSEYSSLTGRTEPTVTIGKRLADRLRADVTSGLSDSREVRSNVEWQLSPRVSVEGSYDNVNDISSSAVGNVGADIRWRLEFR